MSKKMIDTSYNFTIHDNSGFQISFGDVVVSVACHNYLDAFSEMEGNGRCGNKLFSTDKMLMPIDVPWFTFNNAEICIFNQKTDENLNKVFFGPDAEDYEEYIDPESLVDVLVKVRNYAKQLHDSTDPNKVHFYEMEIDGESGYIVYPDEIEQ